MAGSSYRMRVAVSSDRPGSVDLAEQDAPSNWYSAGGIVVLRFSLPLFPNASAYGRANRYVAGYRHLLRCAVSGLRPDVPISNV